MAGRNYSGLFIKYSIIEHQKDPLGIIIKHEGFSRSF